MSNNTVRYETIDDEVVNEISKNAINAKDSDNFIGYASSILQFHHYIASITIELQHYRSKYGPVDPNTNILDVPKTRYTYKQLLERLSAAKNLIIKVPKIGHKANCSSDKGFCDCGADKLFNDVLDAVVRSLEL